MIWWCHCKYKQNVPPTNLYFNINTGKKKLSLNLFKYKSFLNGWPKKADKNILKQFTSKMWHLQVKKYQEKMPFHQDKGIQWFEFLIRWKRSEKLTEWSLMVGNNIISYHIQVVLGGGASHSREHLIGQ